MSVEHFLLYFLGAVILYFFYLRISRKFKAGVAAESSETMYLEVLSGSTDGLWEWDLKSNRVFYSGRFLEILEFSPEESSESIDFFHSRLHPDDAGPVLEALDLHMKSDVPFNMECRLQKKYGDYLWFIIRAQAIKTQVGEPARISGWIHNITENKNTELELKTALEEIKELKEKLESEKTYLQEEITINYVHENIVGASDAINYVLFKIEQVACTDAIVLLLGETGTGKELAARSIHRLSHRSEKSLIKVNCATLPPNLVESELFGHEKGAFTGADAKRLGRFEIADNSSLFLDEIGELPLELQPKLLRVIQDGEFERVGGSTTLKTNVRVIAATNRNLEAEVKAKRFREDLWFRLNVFPITMPPLRDRREDIPLLTVYLIEKICRRLGTPVKTIPNNVMESLKSYHWSGNIRELENVLERGVINSSGPVLRLIDQLLKPDISKISISGTLEEVERDYITRVLEQTRWKVSGENGASTILGLDRSTLRAKMRKLGIQKP